MEFKIGHRVTTTLDYPTHKHSKALTGIGNAVKGFIVDHKQLTSAPDKDLYQLCIEDDIDGINYGHRQYRWINGKYLELDKGYYRKQKIAKLLNGGKYI